MQTTHTPGPWTAVYDQNIGGFAPTWIIEKNGVGYSGICRLKTHPDELPEVAANARLIASAPELLETLKLCLHRDDIANDCLGDAIRAAIDKAEGRQHTTNPPDQLTTF